MPGPRRPGPARLPPGWPLRHPGRGCPDNDLPARRQPMLLTPAEPGATPVLIRARPNVAHPCPDGNPGPGRDHDRRPPMTAFPPGPRSGDDTYDLIDDALAVLAERRCAW